jgi:hypothetical protein
MMNNMPEQQQRTTGIVVIVAAVGMTFGLLGAEITSLEGWEAATTPSFVGKAFIHISTVIASAIGGNLIGKRRKNS